MTQEALKLALEALGDPVLLNGVNNAKFFISQALAQPTSGEYALGYAEGFNDACKPAQPAQEPVAWLYPEGLEALQAGKCWTAYPIKHDSCTIPLLLCTPPQENT